MLQVKYITHKATQNVFNFCFDYSKLLVKKTIVVKQYLLLLLCHYLNLDYSLKFITFIKLKESSIYAKQNITIYFDCHIDQVAELSFRTAFLCLNAPYRESNIKENSQSDCQDRILIG